MRRVLGQHPLQLAAIAVGTLAAVLFPAFYGDQSYVMSVATLFLIYGLVTVTLNLLIGYGGQVSLGHAGLLAVGAYTAAVLANRAPVPLPIEILAAGLAAALVGFILGLPTSRLHGHYLAIVTLGFGVAISQIALNMSSITNGFEGLIVPSPQIGNFTLDTAGDTYYLSLVVVGLSLLAILSVLGTSTGRSFMAVRDSEQAAVAMGINVWRAKLTLFTLSAFFTGVAGDLFAHLENLVAPSAFPFSLSLLFLAMVIVGGLASVWGSLAGSLVLVVVQEVASSKGGLSTTIIGAAVVLVLLVVPDGLATLPRQLLRLIARPRQEAAMPEIPEQARRRASGGT